MQELLKYVFLIGGVVFVFLGDYGFGLSFICLAFLFKPEEIFKN